MKLTDEEIKDILVSIDPDTKRLPPGFRDFARAIEAALSAKQGEQEAVDAAGNPKPKANILESALIGTLNQVKAWADSEASAPLPREILMRVDAVLMTAEMRRTDIGKGL